MLKLQTFSVFTDTFEITYCNSIKCYTNLRMFNKPTFSSSKDIFIKCDDK